MQTCPQCDKPVPDNELANYRRCEDCWVANGYTGAEKRQFSGAGKFQKADKGRRSTIQYEFRLTGRDDTR